MSTKSCFIIIIMTVKIIYILVSDRVWLRVAGNLGLYERNHDISLNKNLTTKNWVCIARPEVIFTMLQEGKFGRHQNHWNQSNG